MNNLLLITIPTYGKAYLYPLFFHIWCLIQNASAHYLHRLWLMSIFSAQLTSFLHFVLQREKITDETRGVESVFLRVNTLTMHMLIFTTNQVVIIIICFGFYVYHQTAFLSLTIYNCN